MGGISDEELSALKEKIQSVGLCVQIPCEPSQLVGDWILLKGEPLWLADQDQLLIGDGSSCLRDLTPIGVPFLPFCSKDLSGVIVQKLWGELKGTARLYELIFKVLPAPIAPDFIAGKPEKFSFLQGESLAGSGLESLWGKEMPRGEGAFFRNFGFTPQEDPDGLRYAGARQETALQEHEHSLHGQESRDLRFEIGASWQPYSQGKDHPWDMRTLPLEKGASESRPVNFVVLALMRIKS